MKRIVPILLLIILLFQFEGASLLFFLRHRQIKSEVYTQISQNLTSDLSIVKISKHSQRDLDFQWVEEDEVRYKGKMYDVVAKEEKGDTIILKCIADHKDDLAYSSYKKSQKRTDLEVELSHKKAFAKLIKSNYLVEDHPCLWVECKVFPHKFFLPVPVLKRSIIPPCPPPEV
ncbi:hypothetical protein [Solitalea lacus]|uniref:hypothetical protein n=1 Tax=Solitalea lacus TaxID=2911172 RepID=UPI001EDBBD7C|nr:hypothetical protein [Solitalea lacus]UKJ07481.1 hypothetical protein L2B55_18425 [Solitalea lacus]